MLNDLTDFFKKLHPDVTVNLYGSFSTGLCLYDADIDLVLTYSDEIDKAQAVNKLREIRKAMDNLDYLKKIDLITTARVPIIKCEVETVDGLIVPVDLSIQTSDVNHAGKYAAMFINYIKYNYYGYIPLVIIVKMLLHAYKLNNNYTGGLCS